MSRGASGSVVATRGGAVNSPLAWIAVVVASVLGLYFYFSNTRRRRGDGAQPGGAPAPAAPRASTAKGLLQILQSGEHKGWKVAVCGDVFEASSLRFREPCLLSLCRSTELYLFVYADDYAGKLGEAAAKMKVKETVDSLHTELKARGGLVDSGFQLHRLLLSSTGYQKGFEAFSRQLVPSLLVVGAGMEEFAHGLAKHLPFVALVDPQLTSVVRESTARRNLIYTPSLAALLQL